MAGPDGSAFDARSVGHRPARSAPTAPPVPTAARRSSSARRRRRSRSAASAARRSCAPATQLRKIGESAELFDDHSPLQLGAAGKYQGAPFTLVGRLQYRYADGTWNEWHALFESGPERRSRAGSREDNGRYVVAFDAPLHDAGAAARERCSRARRSRSTARAGRSPRSSPRKLIAAAGRAAAPAEPRAGLRRRRPAQRARRGRHARLHRAGAAARGRSAARSRSPTWR